MTDDAKEWVTIKIPAGVRDQARDDNRTYGEIMRAGLNTEPTGDVDTEEIVESLKNELSMLPDPGVTVSEGDVERLYARLDELEAQLPDKVGENVEGRLR